MSRVDRSPEQLDAEAAAPVDIEAAIRFHRQLYQAELYVPRLTTESPPVFIEADGTSLPAEASKLGPTLSWPLQSLISYRRQNGDDIATPGYAFPWSVGLARVRLACRRTDSEHWDREEWRGSLCWSLVNLTVRREYRFDRACHELGVDPERTVRLLVRLLRRIEETVHELQAKATEVVNADKGRHDWQSPEHTHHTVTEGLHNAHPDAGGCIQCWRRRTAA